MTQEDNLDEELLEAAWQNDVLAARIALERGASVHARNENGSSLLDWAVLLDSERLVGLAIDHGADVNATIPGSESARPLYEAVRLMRVGCTIQLLAHLDIDRNFPRLTRLLGERQAGQHTRSASERQDIATLDRLFGDEQVSNEVIDLCRRLTPTLQKVSDEASAARLVHSAALSADLGEDGELRLFLRIRGQRATELAGLLSQGLALAGAGDVHLQPSVAPSPLPFLPRPRTIESRAFFQPHGLSPDEFGILVGDGLQDRALAGEGLLPALQGAEQLSRDIPRTVAFPGCGTSGLLIATNNPLLIRAAQKQCESGILSVRKSPFALHGLDGQQEPDTHIISGERQALEKVTAADRRARAR